MPEREAATPLEGGRRARNCATVSVGSRRANEDMMFGCRVEGVR